jgi:hypothetical protein
MSLHETWRTRKYWESIGGLLIEEFVAVKGGKNQGRRPLDAVIVLGEKNEIHSGNYYDISGKDIISVQTKSGRIGMYLLGQAYFSRFLLEKFEPKSIRSVAICGREDIIMQELAERHGVEIVVIPDEEKPINIV